MARRNGSRLRAEVVPRKRKDLGRKMMPYWYWAALGALTALTAYLQFRIVHIQQSAKKREELFMIVTENAADMIALVDMKGRRLYNGPA